MSSQGTATRWAAWESREGQSSTPFPGSGAAGGPLPGVPILAQQFPGTLNLVVELAFGANLAADPSTWSWTDVTKDVKVDGNGHVIVQQGKVDVRASSGPAQATFRLDNRQNKYGRSPFAQYFPNMHRGTPVRVRAVYSVNPPAGRLLFQGRVTALAPVFDSTGRYAMMNVTASGILRRLGLGNQQLQSTLRQYTPRVSNLVAYWPMEDQTGALSLPAAAGLGAAPLTLVGPVQLRGNATVASSDAIPVLNNSSIVGFMPPYPNTGAIQIRALTVWPGGVGGTPLPDQTIVWRLFCVGGTIARWDIVYGTGGSLKALGYSAYDNSLQATIGPVAFNVDGTAGQLNVSFTTSGANITVQLSTYQIGSGAAGGTTTTVTGQSLGVLQQIQIMPFGVSTSFATGHLSVQSQASDIFENAQPLNAYDTELAYQRVGRLLGLVGISTNTTWGDGSTLGQRTGPQRIDTILNLLRECESTDAALMFDGQGDSLVFNSHPVLENQTTYVTVDATTQLTPPFAPMDDDAYLRNYWTVQQRNGGSVVASDQTSPQGVPTVGQYPDSVTVNVCQNTTGAFTGGFGPKAQQNLASWFVHRDTPDGYRVPSLQLAFHRNPELLQAFLRGVEQTTQTHMDVRNLSSAYPQMPPGLRQFLVIGYTHVIDKFTWSTTVNVTPNEVFNVGVVAKASGDTGPYLMRPDTQSSQVGADVPIGATAIQVYSVDPGAWTTRADDFPFLVNIGGIAVNVTNVTGSSSPQTFTVDPTTVTKFLPQNTAVNVWQPLPLAIGGTS